jgi:hypothetical protein
VFSLFKSSAFVGRGQLKEGIKGLMKSLTICYVTARKEPNIEWFLQSLEHQVKPGDPVNVIVVDFHGDMGDRSKKFPVKYVLPKPNVWQGEHRLTQKEWWATSAYRNTGLCCANSEWIAWIDDRSVLMPTWLQAVRDAMAGNYAVCGAYEKRTGMTVENGFIRHGGIVIGEDPRRTYRRLSDVPGSYWFGCTNALPVEWALRVNGYDESCDSLGLEDCIFGQMLQLNGHPIKYDPRMKIVEDRSSEFYEAAVGRTDKGTSPNDKSHALLQRVAGKKQATHHWNLREVRDQVLRGEPFPIPTEPTTDWWDGKPLSEFP